MNHALAGARGKHRAGPGTGRIAMWEGNTWPRVLAGSRGSVRFVLFEELVTLSLLVHIRRVKRLVVLVHLYLGVAMCALFVMWFATGIVLMYAPFPGFRQATQFARMPVLDCTRCALTLADALGAMPARDTASAVRLGMLLERPAWRYLGLDRRWHVLFADDRSALDAITPAHARRIAARWARLDEADVRESVLITEPDQWTVEAVFRHQLPLHRVEFADDARTRVYVSSAGGEALLSTTRRERALAWLGAIPHWIYPRMLRVRVATWTWTIISVSALGLVMSLAGLTIGIWQFRFRRKVTASGRVLARSPYRTGWMRWHQYLGLLFGACTFTWLFSGMLSVDPFEWSPGTDPSPAERLAFAGGALDGARFQLQPAAAWRVPRDIGTRELQPVLVAGRPFWVAYEDATHTRLVAADTTVPHAIESLEPSLLAQATTTILGSARMSTDVLREPDDYFYSTGEAARTFPVLRVRYDDPAHSAFYVDPRTVTIVMKQVTRSRLERWLYSGLHDLDFRVLTVRRPFWDIVVIVLSLGGLALAATGLVTAWRWTAHWLGIPAGRRR